MIDSIPIALPTLHQRHNKHRKAKKLSTPLPLPTPIHIGDNSRKCINGSRTKHKIYS